MNEQFGKKMNQGIDGNMKLFWKVVSRINEGKSRELYQDKG